MWTAMTDLLNVQRDLDLWDILGNVGFERLEVDGVAHLACHCHGLINQFKLEVLQAETRDLGSERGSYEARLFIIFGYSIYTEDRELRVSSRFSRGSWPTETWGKRVIWSSSPPSPPTAGWRECNPTILGIDRKMDGQLRDLRIIHIV